MLGPQEVRDPVRKGLDAVLLQQERDLAAMPGGVGRDMQEHLAACHPRGLAIREGEGHHLIHLFRLERIGIVGVPVRRRPRLARQLVERRELDRAVPDDRAGALRDCG